VEVSLRRHVVCCYIRYDCPTVPA